MIFGNPANNPMLKQMQEQLDRLAHDAEYHPGDIISMDVQTLTGYLTTNATDIVLMIPICKPIGNDVSTVSISGTLILRGVNGYVGGREGITVQDYTNSVVFNGSVINLRIRNTEAWDGATNNTPAGGQFSGTVTFS